jgi:Ca-activated chloride channel homolog
MTRLGQSAVLLVVLSFLFCNANQASAQTDLNDVHITSRLTTASLDNAASKTAEVSKAEYLASASYGTPAKPTIRTSVDLVMVPVTITDSLHRPVLGLDQDNFELFENKKPREIKHFSSEDAPISLGIIVDASGSMADKIERILRNAATRQRLHQRSGKDRE